MAPKRGFLFPVKALARVFRGKFVAALTDLRTAGQLPSVVAEPAWARLKAALYTHDWVVYAKAPLGGPGQVLDYLGRYTHRVAISNERIIAVGPDEVAFRVCAPTWPRARNAPCDWGASRFSHAFSCTYCPPASNVSATTGCSRPPTRHSDWPPHVPRWTPRPPNRP